MDFGFRKLKRDDTYKIKLTVSQFCRQTLLVFSLCPVITLTLMPKMITFLVLFIEAHETQLDPVC